MSKVLAAYKRIYSKFFLFLSLVSVLLLSSLFSPQSSYAVTLDQLHEDEKEEIVQPFELTRPAGSREGAYEEAAKLVEDPKALVKAQNQEEKAQEQTVEK